MTSQQLVRRGLPSLVAFALTLTALVLLGGGRLPLGAGMQTLLDLAAAGVVGALVFALYNPLRRPGLTLVGFVAWYAMAFLSLSGAFIIIRAAGMTAAISWGVVGATAIPLGLVAAHLRARERDRNQRREALNGMRG